MADGSAPLRVVREMAISRAEFLRSLPGAVNHRPVLEREGALVVRDGGREARIRFAELPPRGIGSLVLPRARVELELAGYRDAEACAFLERFDLYFRRGGG